MTNQIKLPSAHQGGDEVFVRFNEQSELTGAVHAVHFYAGKVKYDIDVFVDAENFTRVYNVDSAFITSMKNSNPKKSIKELRDDELLELANIMGQGSSSDESLIFQYRDLLCTNKLYIAQTNITGIGWFRAFQKLQEWGYEVATID